LQCAPASHPITQRRLMAYLLHILVLIGIYIILAVSLDLLAGQTGLLSIAHAAFYGVGAYCAALMALDVGSPVLLNLACAVVLGGAVGALVGAPALRIRGDYFVIATFAFQVITFSVMNNWVALTRGPMGLPGIPPPSFFGWQIDARWEFFLLVWGCAGAVLWASRRIVNSPFGRVLRAIREDEVFAAAAGKNVANCKVLVFALAAGMAAGAGGLYAHYMTFIDPTSFTVAESIFILSIVIIGGAGSLWGPVIGAVVLVTLPELLRFVGMPSSIAANVRQILYGGALVAFMMWRPQGLMGEYAFEKGGPEG